MNTSSVRWLALIGLSIALATPISGLGSRADAAFAGKNGPIVLSLDNALVPNDAAVCSSCQGLDADLFVFSPQSGVLTKLTSGIEDDWWPAWAPDGRRLALARSPVRNAAFDIFILDTVTGTASNITNTALDNEDGPSWSPDGKKIVFSAEPNDPTRILSERFSSDIYVMDLETRAIERLVDDPQIDFDPAWSPDGTAIAYSKGGELRMIASDGSFQLTVASSSRVEDGNIVGPTWSPNGKQIAFTTYAGSVWIVNRDGSDLRRITSNSSSAYYATWSPDGRWIAFTGERLDSDSDQTPEVSLHKIRPDGSGEMRLVELTVDAYHARIDWAPKP